MKKMSEIEENTSTEGQNVPIKLKESEEISVTDVSLNAMENDAISRTNNNEINNENETELIPINKPVMDQTSQFDGSGVPLKVKTADKETSSRIERSRMTLPSMRSNDFPITNLPKANEAEQALISKLEEEIKEITSERDKYQKMMVEAEKKIAELEASIHNSLNDTNTEGISTQRAMAELKSKLDQTTMQLEDRAVVVANQEKQIDALNNQVSTLKEVVAITRDLLQIRNTEVKHLQAEVDDMETRISEERERHNTIMTKMDAAVRLNADLKKEYETQLHLFKDLRQKYEEKVTLLSEEKRALEANQTVAK